jgi:plasmid replication initiation protein
MQLENPQSIVNISNILNLTRQEFSIIEKHLFLLTLWKLKASQVYDKNAEDSNQPLVIQIPIKELKETNVSRIREALDKITSRKIYFEDNTKNKEHYGYRVPFPSADYFAKERSYGYVELKLNPDCKKLFLELSKGYTKTDISAVFSLKSTYSIRMYELMSMNAKQGSWTVELEKLKFLIGLDLQKYKSFTQFEKNILEYSQKELWDHCNIHFEWEVAEKQRKKITALTFHITTRNTQESREINYFAEEQTAWADNLTPVQIKEYFARIQHSYNFTADQREFIVSNRPVFSEFVRMHTIIDTMIEQGKPVLNRTAYIAKSLKFDKIKFGKAGKKASAKSTPLFG